ncbi:unnamed protein product [Allacma fusca]|uniref:DNA/RNA non-specific endonuclease/pyrophosphatase/phosphodiesterase domain-containing protein n=1 Tax=Allacma fusca TaxID=39272 RepID=A0A8J2JCC3_9HEXA|nr:unnamed protein product [Allacma fusca]
MNILLSFGFLLAMTISSRGYTINKVCSRIIIRAHKTNIIAPFIDVCHNDTASETLYTLHTIDGPNLKSNNAKDPKWRPDQFYPNISVDNCYLQLEQNKTLDKILGSAKQRKQYIQPNRDMFFASGHLTPKVDGVTDDEQQATFYFVNAIPQWHVINKGNWQELEKVVRALAINNKKVLKVYTGAYGVTTLKDDKRFYKPIYLGKDRKGNLMNVLPAPNAALTTAQGARIAGVVSVASAVSGLVLATASAVTSGVAVILSIVDVERKEAPSESIAAKDPKEMMLNSPLLANTGRLVYRVTKRLMQLVAFTIF